MNWKLDEAQQKLSLVIDAVTSEPQLIFKQDELVAAIVEPKLFQEFLVWYQQQKTPSLADAFTELRQLCAEEDYILDIPARQGERHNPLAEE
ncbi:prevent-host-death protein [Rivularia sp. UHCC 0363]|uniref:prevent-host-death protein n=1 Tax=Rivularia sp. UHCC 0363 TaxID=3110244 RepID=UPI002B2185C7|nr:prevent-host-death protein [Rivularia sp. UHCC 0363]MEA5594172.1 prevent-host-death protein [Rivularia sp. UHCC 0363]